MTKVYSPGIFTIAVCNRILGNSPFEDLPNLEALARMYETYKGDPRSQGDTPLTRDMEWMEQQRRFRNY